MSMTAVAPSRRGGRDARRAIRLARDTSMLPQLTRGIPYVEPMSQEQVLKIHNASMAILEEVGVDFRDEIALEQWKKAGGQKTSGSAGFAPTSGLLAGEGHIPLACTPEPSSAAPVTGAVDECEVDFRHEMQVTRIHESPRVTRPYTDAQWQQVLALGEQVVTRPVVETCGNGDTVLDIGRKNSLVKPKHWRARLNEAFAPEPFNRHKPLRRIVGFKRDPPVPVCCR